VDEGSDFPSACLGTNGNLKERRQPKGGADDLGIFDAKAGCARSGIRSLRPSFRMGGFQRDSLAELAGRSRIHIRRGRMPAGALEEDTGKLLPSSTRARTRRFAKARTIQGPDADVFTRLVTPNIATTHCAG